MSAPAELRAALRAAIRTVADALGAAGIDWLVTGSCARALCGFATDPRDLDIEVAAADVAPAAAALGLTAADDVDTHTRSSRAQGALGTVELDVTGGLVLTGPGGTLPSDFPLMLTYATETNVDGAAVLIAPVEEQIVRILVSGNEARRQRFVAEAPEGFVARSDYVERRLDAARAAR